jgi:CheY-like chemotaxis protein
MRQVLDAAGEHWEFIEAENGTEAIAKAQEFKPDLVILDFVMPGTDGITASREIANLLPGVPILMHTLYSSAVVKFEAAKNGVRKLIPKSETSVLVSAVTELLHSPPPEASETTSEPASANAAIAETHDRIRELCALLLEAKDDEPDAGLIVELRDALHRHIEQLRARVTEYPVAIERSIQSALPRATTAQENAVEDSAPEPPEPTPAI